jgi:hypothetical protein
LIIAILCVDFGASANPGNRAAQAYPLLAVKLVDIPEVVDHFCDTENLKDFMANYDHIDVDCEGFD